MSGTDKQLLLQARELRARAEEVLAKAETMQDAEAQRMMRNIAANYEILAQRIEYEAGGEGEA